MVLDLNQLRIDRGETENDFKKKREIEQEEKIRSEQRIINNYMKIDLNQLRIDRGETENDFKKKREIEQEEKIRSEQRIIEEKNKEEQELNNLAKACNKLLNKKINDRLCIADNCNEFALYHFSDISKKMNNKAICCSTHKFDGMINVRKNRCNNFSCDIIVDKKNCRHGYCLSCFIQKLEDKLGCKIINFAKDRLCINDNCNNIALFNYWGLCSKMDGRGLYCEAHKDENMINVRINKCNNFFCDTSVDKNRNNGYCIPCFIQKFPDEKVFRNYKTKEKTIDEFILDNFSNMSWILDRKINNGCSKRRPDLLLDLGYQILMIELDENQHKTYDCSCENKRLMELSQDLNHRPLVLIRFNPDSYINNLGKKIKSPWGFDGFGICVVKKKEEWNERLNILKNTINYWINEENITNKTIEVIELFYDNHN